MGLGIAMIIAYIPFIWIVGKEIMQDMKEQKKIKRDYELSRKP